MRITIRRKNLEITPALQVYIESKLLKPIRRLISKTAGQELPILDMEFYRNTRHHRKGDVYHAEANLNIGRRAIRAKVDDVDMRSAIDLLEEELRRSILDFKGRARARELRGERQAKKELRLDPAARLHRKGRIRNEGN